MHTAHIRFVDADHFHTEWQLYRDGKAAEVIKCARSEEIITQAICQSPNGKENFRWPISCLCTAAAARPRPR